MLSSFRSPQFAASFFRFKFISAWLTTHILALQHGAFRLSVSRRNHARARDSLLSLILSFGRGRASFALGRARAHSCPALSARARSFHFTLRLGTVRMDPRSLPRLRAPRSRSLLFYCMLSLSLSLISFLYHIYIQINIYLSIYLSLSHSSPERVARSPPLSR